MTLAIERRVKVYVGNGVTTVFPYDFLIPLDSDLFVYLYSIAAQTLTLVSAAAYSVTGIGDEAFGSVTYPLAGSPVASTHKIVIVRRVPYDQLTDIINQGGFYPAVLEAQLDAIVMQIQQLAEMIGRAPKTVAGEVAFALALPIKTSLANHVLAFNADGEPIAGPLLADLAGAISAVEWTGVADTITTGGVAQTIAAENASVVRRKLNNPSNQVEPLYLARPGPAVIGSGIEIWPGGDYDTGYPPDALDKGEWSVIAATTGHVFTLREKVV